MTASEWWSATDSLPVIDWLFFDTFATDRKFRLFAAACCHRVESRIHVPEVLAALACVEQFADGVVPGSQALAICHKAVQAYQDRWSGIPETTAEADVCRAVISALSDTANLPHPFHRSREWYDSEDDLPYAYWAASEAAEAASGEGVVSGAAEMSERFAQAHLLHDIFGPLPFRDIAVAPSWLTADVRLLAKGIYDAKAFDRMPILADALQDAGCDSPDILDHCRAANWEHVRGCWVIDLLLGRPWRE
jgi:hypothetical protein